ncbi:MAG TPA: TROVE domain-containing protein [Candidatus Limnocylindrales bacterium]|nr:TROVE domain-containing protein [Candidatus Limnocylindrales bacterium]
MVKFAIRRKKPNVTAPVASRSGEADAATYEGGAGFTRDAKSELFLLALTNMVGEATFYESSRDRDRRFARLVAQVTKEDPAWIAAFVPFLRREMHLRSASVVMAAEFAHARRAAASDGDEATAKAKAGTAAGPSTRSVIASALDRADEPAELLAYWHQEHGRRMPQPVKRGIADAVGRLFTERAALKYDGQSRVYRMADVIDLVHPDPVDARQSAVFKWLLDKRHDREDIAIDAEQLPIVAARAELEQMPLDDRRALLGAPDVGERFKRAGVTWEWLSGWLNGPMDAQAWEAVIPSMGYMALLRNLRNFDDAGVSDATRKAVAAKLADPAEVASSRQLPLRFYSAWKSLSTMHWGDALERALELSLQNVPALPGRTLVMVDVSGSMAAAMSNKSKAQRWELAALFGAALATRAEKADVFAFQSTHSRVDIRNVSSVLRGIDMFKPLVGGGTNTWPAVRASFSKHDRVVILTDEQAFFDYRSATVPADEIPVPIYTFNLAGYKTGHLPSGSHQRYTFGGLSDRGFAAITLLERGRDVGWDDVLKARPAGPGAASAADEAADADDESSEEGD